MKAFVWDVVIAHGSEVIARQRRSYGREEMIFDLLHYLALLEQKTNALDQAAKSHDGQRSCRHLLQGATFRATPFSSYST